MKQNPVLEELSEHIKNVLESVCSGSTIIVEADEIDDDQENTKPLEKVEPETDKAVQEMIHKIGILQVHQLYNLVLIPYFKQLSDKFQPNGKAKDPNRLPLLNFYVAIDNMITNLNKISGDRIHNITHQGWNQKLLTNYQSIFEANKEISNQIAEIYKTMNLEPISNNESLQDIETHINTNVKAIADVFSVLFSPIENGYIDQLKELLPDVAKKSPVYKQANIFAEQSAKFFTTDQSKMLKDIVKNALPKFYGTWLLSNLETLIAGSDILNYEVKFGTGNNPHLATPSAGTQKFSQDYSSLFKQFNGLIGEYDKKLYRYSVNTKLENFIQDGQINVVALRNHLRKTDVGFFNQKTNLVLKAVEKAVAEHQKDLFNQEQEENQKKKQQADAERQEQENKWTGVRKYLEHDLHFDADTDMSSGQKEIVSVLLRSLDTYHEYKGDNTATFDGIGNEKDSRIVHDILKDATIAQGGLIDLIQDWLLEVFPDETKLVSVGKYSITDLRKDVANDYLNFKGQTDENRGSGEKRLPDLFPIKDFQVRRYNLYWHANKPLQQVYKNFVPYRFSDNLTNLSDADWKEAIVNDQFYENKVWKEGNKEAEIQSALANMKEKGKANLFSKDAGPLLKRLIVRIPMSEKFIQKTGAHDFRTLLNQYTNKDLNTVDDETISEILKVIKIYFDRFANWYGAEYNLRSLRAPMQRAKFFAENILRYVTGNVTADDINKLAKSIETTFRLSSDIGNKGINGGSKSEYVRVLSIVIKSLKQLMDSNIQDNNSNEDNNFNEENEE